MTREAECVDAVRRAVYDALLELLGADLPADTLADTLAGIDKDAIRDYFPFSTCRDICAVFDPTGACVLSAFAMVALGCLAEELPGFSPSFGAAELHLRALTRLSLGLSSPSRDSD